MADIDRERDILALALDKLTSGWNLRDNEADDVTSNTGASVGATQHHELVAAIMLARRIVNGGYSYE